MRFLEIRFFGRDKRSFVNPLATLILIPLISAPQILGVLFWDDFEASVDLNDPDDCHDSGDSDDSHDSGDS